MVDRDRGGVKIREEKAQAKMDDGKNEGEPVIGEFKEGWGGDGETGPNKTRCGMMKPGAR